MISHGRGRPSTGRWRSGVALIGLVAAAGACVAAQRPDDVAVYASGSDLESGNPLVTVHPLSRQMQRFVLFVTLARYDSLLAPEPYFARDWAWSADRRTLTFRLHEGVRWHDGAPTTARDVAFTVLAARDPATGYPRAADLASVDTVLAANDSTLMIRFRASQPAFPLVLCELPVLPEHLLRDVRRSEMRRAPFNLAPVGNGPFRFVERVPGQRWVFERNDGFPAALGGPPRLSGLVITVVDEATTKFAGLAAGDLDVAGISPTMAYMADRDPALEVLDYPVLFATGIVFNVHAPPFDDARVRRAVSLSLDRARIVHAALAGYARPASGPVVPESPYALPGDAVQDNARADSLLDAAGWMRGGDGRRRRGGREFAFELLTVGSGDNAIEQLAQADLAARGVRMGIRQMEMGAFLTLARDPMKRFDALFTGIPGDLSLAYLGAMFESRQAGGALDYAGYRNPQLDASFERARTAATTEARVAAWHEVQRVLELEHPVAWIYHARGVQGVSARLRNARMDLRGEMVTVSAWELAPAGAGTLAAR